MYIINSDAEFHVIIGKAISQAINGVLDDIFKELRQEIEHDIYNAYSPKSDYQRSGKLPDAWEITTRGLFGLLEFRYDMLPSEPTLFQHNSPYGWDVRERIFDLLEEGYGAYNYHTGKPIMERPMWDLFLQKVDRKFDGWMRKALRKQNLVVV